MTDLRLRDLLADVVEDIPSPDLAGGAWKRSLQVRKRRRQSALVGVAAITAGAIIVGSDWISRDDLSTPPNPAATSPTPVASPSTTWGAEREPDAMLAGAPVWLGPRKSDEGGLPLLGESWSGLPSTIDLARHAADIESSPLAKALAAFEVGDNGAEQFREIVLLGSRGELRRLNVDGLDDTYVDPDGNRLSILTEESLSPDGTRLMLRQDGALMVFDLSDNTWQEVSTRGRSSKFPRWTPDSDAVVIEDIAVTVPGEKLTDPGPPLRAADESRFPMSEWWGPARSINGTTAQAGFTKRVTAVDAGTENPEVVAVEGDRNALLVLPATYEDRDSRWKGCCAVVSWLDPDTLAFESRGSDYAVLAWNVKTGRFGKVTTVKPAAGTHVYTSYADLGV